MQSIQSRHTNRRGIATLEFVMALPLILLLLALLWWLGLSGIGQSQVTVRARTDAWKSRFENVEQQPFVFPSAVGFYEQENDFAPGHADTQVFVSPIFANMPNPAAKHTTLAGSWDYTVLPLDKAINWDALAKIYASAMTGTVQDGVALAKNPVDGLLSALGNIGSATSAEGSEPSGTPPAIGDAGTSVEQDRDGNATVDPEQKEQTQADGQQRQDEAQRRQTEKKKELNAAKMQTAAELRQARQELAQVQQRLRSMPSGKDKESQRQREQANARTARLRRKVERLEMRRDDIDSDLADVT